MASSNRLNQIIFRLTFLIFIHRSPVAVLLKLASFLTRKMLQSVFGKAEEYGATPLHGKT